jgi:hypothetical protein
MSDEGGEQGVPPERRQGAVSVFQAGVPLSRLCRSSLKSRLTLLVVCLELTVAGFGGALGISYMGGFSDNRNLIHRGGFSGKPMPRQTS